MNKQLGMDNIEQRVLLLAIYKSEPNETLQDILLTLENSKLFDLKTGKKYLKNLKNLGFIEGSNLTLLGIEEAKQVENEFKL